MLFFVLRELLTKATNPFEELAEISLVNPATKRQVVYLGVKLTGADENTHLFIKSAMVFETESDDVEFVETGPIDVPLVNCFMPAVRDVVGEVGGVTVERTTFSYENKAPLAVIGTIRTTAGMSMLSLRVLKPDGVVLVDIARP